MDRDDGLGTAMAQSYAQQLGRDAQQLAAKLEVRVALLEERVLQLEMALRGGLTAPS